MQLLDTTFLAAAKGGWFCQEKTFRFSSSHTLTFRNQGWLGYLSQISSKPETFHTRQNMVKHAKVLQQPRNKCQVNDTIGMLVSASCLSELHVCCSKVWVQPAKCGRYTNSLSLKSPFAVFCSSLATRVQRNICSIVPWYFCRHPNVHQPEP